MKKSLSSFGAFYEDHRQWVSLKICKAATPSKEVKVKRERRSSTIKLWTHLEKFHIEIYKQLRPSGAPNTLTNYFSKTYKFLSRSPEHTKKEYIDVIFKTDAPFKLLAHPQFKRFCNYLAQYGAGIPSSMSKRWGLEKVFQDERDKLQELLWPIERGSLTSNTWTTRNNVAILGIRIHWIDTSRKSARCWGIGCITSKCHIGRGVISCVRKVWSHAKVFLIFFSLSILDAWF